MNKLRVVQHIIDSGIVAVIRAGTSEEVAQIAEACRAGGITALEITYTTPAATEAIRCLRSKYGAEMLIGAGTVLDPETARIALLAGAEFIVAPLVCEPTARLCNRYQTPYLPGASTIGEVVRALEAGASIVKVFPGEVLGPAFIRAARGPLPQAPLMPTGGVSLENAAEWIAAGSVALGVGGDLTRSSADGDFATITRRAKEFVGIVESARKQHTKR